MSRALVLGELCTDVIIYNPASVPVLGVPVWAEHVIFRLGGSAAYTARGLRTLGLDVQLSGAVSSSDFVAQQGIEELAYEGIDVSKVHQIPNVPMVTSVGVSDGGEKNFVGCSPLLNYSADFLDFSTQDVDLLYFGGYLLYPELWDGSLANLFERIKEGTLISLDVQMLPIPPERYQDKALSEENLEHVDVLFANRQEAFALTGCDDLEGAAETIGSYGPKIVVLKLGAEGSLAWTSDGSYLSEAFDVVARDPIGAGDYFGAAFSYGLLQRWSLQKASEFANAFAALCISSTEGESLPTRSATMTLMEENGRAF